MRAAMWAGVLRRRSLHAHRIVRIARGYNTPVGEPKTYFQPPPQPAKPRRRVFRTLLFGTTCLGLGAYAHSWLYDLPLLGVGIDLGDESGMFSDRDAVHEALVAGAADTAARHTPPMDLERAQEVLESRAGYSVTHKTVAHTAQHPSNTPCEDTWSSGAFTFFNDPAKDWNEWAIFDGHAGPRTSQVLKEFCPAYVGEQLWEAKCMERSYTPDDSHIVDTIKKAFVALDNVLCGQALERIKSGEGNLAHIVATAASAYSGSCALLALYDPFRLVLRVANTGDSRAVLGRWDKESKQYLAYPMSIDQTGHNEDEVVRLNREHPGEEVISPKTKRVLGFEPSRAFGDTRMKWTNDINKRARELFWGPRPIPEDELKTPPYFTAEPEVMETRVRTGEHSDFLIMASDGLWDKMSSEDAVTCVQMWLAKNKPANFLEKKAGILSSLGFGGRKSSASSSIPTFSSASDVAGDDDTYIDEEERCLQWRVSPRHFIVEDDNCGIHLVKNALGGKRRDLFMGVMSVQPPLSRKMRDDITVHVVFFGVDTQSMIKN